MPVSSTVLELPADANEESQAGPRLSLDGDKEQPFYVVSDVHLGADECCVSDFADFLDWLAAGVRSRRPLQVQPLRGRGSTLTPPRTLILLGDILELWAPRGNERYSVIQDALRVFSKLIDLDCRKVYVLGNHDMTLCGGQEFGADNVGANRKKQPVLFDLACENASHLEIFSRHYPCKGETRHAQALALKKTGPSYLFVHGHQFDPSFQRAGISTLFVPLIAGLAATFDMLRYKKLSLGSVSLSSG